MFCKQCGSQIPEGNSFCPQCGANNAPQEPVNQIPIENIQPFDDDDDDGSDATALLIEEPVAPVQPIAPVQPMDAPVQPIAPVQPMDAPVQPVAPVQPMDAPAQPVAPVQNAFNVPQPMNANQPIYNQAPMPVAQPPKKSKAGLIIGIVAGAVVAIIAIIVVISLVAGGGNGAKKAATVTVDYVDITIGEELSSVESYADIDYFFDSDTFDFYESYYDTLPAFTSVFGSIVIGDYDVDIIVSNTSTSDVELRDAVITYVSTDTKDATILDGNISARDIYNGDSSYINSALKDSGFKEDTDLSYELDMIDEYNDESVTNIMYQMKAGTYIYSSDAYLVCANNNTYYLFTLDDSNIMILNSDGFNALMSD